MTRQLLLFFFLFPAFLNAQTDERYLRGAVPEQDGKVVFEKEIAIPSYSKKQIYDVMLEWATNHFNTPDSRVVYSDPEKGEIAATVKEYLVFSSTALSLDRTQANYRLTIECENGKCLVKIGGIRYSYDVAYQREPEIYRAEEWITDAYSLNKQGTKLNRLSGKFRRKTIDRVDELFGSATSAVGNRLLVEAGTSAPTTLPAARSAATVVAIPSVNPTATASTVIATDPAKTTSAVPVTPANPTAPASSSHQVASTPANTTSATSATPIATAPSDSPNTVAPTGYVPLTSGQIPATLQAMLPESRIELSLPGTTGLTEKNAEWKGTGTMFGQTIASVDIPAGGTFDRALGEHGIFRIAFIKPNATEPWMIVECRKQGETTEDARKTLLNEMTNIWIK